MREGPISPGELAKRLHVKRAWLRYNLKPFEDQGLIVSDGTTANRRYALAGRPAKEAP
jgi:DNA-binding MarR family transcriptional regulator